MERQLSTTLIGPMHVTRAVLPVMRRQRAGHIITISSARGLSGSEFCTAYAASKFGLEGWMESLRLEIAPFGIHTTIVNPGFFRTELLSPESTNLCRDRNRRLCRPPGSVRRGMDRPERQTVRRSRQARRCPRGGRRRAAADAPVHSPER